MKVAPSILAADIGDLDAALAAVGENVDAIHVDVMDGHFVPNLTFGLPLVRSLRKRTALPLDLHLMVSNPDDLLAEYVTAGADWISVHYEACPHLHRTLSRIRELGARAGVALNPGSSVGSIEAVLPVADYVVLMSVNPGFAGQQFIAQSFARAAALRRMIEELAPTVELEIDGGMGPHNVAAAAAAGVDICVSGSQVFGSDDPARTVAELRLGGVS